jgi:hypothetical protein
MKANQQCELNPVQRAALAALIPAFVDESERDEFLEIVIDAAEGLIFSPPMRAPTYAQTQKAAQEISSHVRRLQRDLAQRTNSSSSTAFVLSRVFLGGQRESFRRLEELLRLMRRQLARIEKLAVVRKAGRGGRIAKSFMDGEHQDSEGRIDRQLEPTLSHGRKSDLGERKYIGALADAWTAYGEKDDLPQTMNSPRARQFADFAFAGCKVVGHRPGRRSAFDRRVERCLKDRGRQN